jgi:hypothetical protein
MCGRRLRVKSGGEEIEVGSARIITHHRFYSACVILWLGVEDKQCGRRARHRGQHAVLVSSIGPLIGTWTRDLSATLRV